MKRAALLLMALLTLAACATFDKPDDDPALCENGHRPNANGDCPR